MKKILLLLSAAALWNCTDYVADWDNKYENSFAANGEIRICNEGEATIINQNGCSTSFVCSNNSWVIKGTPQCQSETKKICVEGSTTAIIANNCAINYICSGNAWIQYGKMQCLEVAPRVCEEGVTIPVTENGCVANYICSGNAWVLKGEIQCENVLPSDVFVDARDGQTYRFVTIGSQVWMAENLKYNSNGSSCYNDNVSNCTNYGRLYTQSAAKSACPSGWHLPSESEWNKLLSFTGDCRALMVNGIDEGYDEYGFSAKLSGSSLNAPGTYPIFWTSTSDKDVNLNKDMCEVCESQKNEKIPVRCLKDVVSGQNATSSSSAPKSSSSSVKVVEPADEVVGSITDSRDGQKYKTVKIGSQMWMAKNLNYKTANSFCYNNNASNCTKYGRLYTWAAAISACPSGWHLPTQTEWNTLFTAVGGRSTAGKILKSTSGWTDGGNGTNAFSFSALPAGGRNNNGGYYEEGVSANFWSSTEGVSSGAYDVLLYYFNGEANLFNYTRDYGFSVRCLKD